jgi:hypothetical protein
MNKILCIGEALIDMICTDKGSSLSEGQHFLKKRRAPTTHSDYGLRRFCGMATKLVLTHLKIIGQ